MSLKDLTDKLDIDGIVSNVKQMINPEDQMPHPEQGDKVGELIAECSALAHDLWREHEQFARHNEQLHIKLNQLFKELREDPKVMEAEAKKEAAEKQAAAKPAEEAANEPEVEAKKPEDKPE